MKKLKLILDEVTVINFPFVGGLFKRYFLLTLFIPLFAAGFATWYYTSQHDVYRTNISFKNAATEPNSPLNALAKLLGQEKTEFSRGEVLTVVGSYDFSKQLAEKIVEHPDFEKMNFGSLVGSGNLTNRELAATCKGDRTCLVNTLSQAIPEFYAVQTSTFAGSIFTLGVNSRDPYTSEVLLKLVVETMNDMRVNRFKNFLAEQLVMTEGLLKNQSSDASKYDELTFRKEALQSKIVQLDGRITNMEGVYIGIRSRMTNAKAKLRTGHEILTDRVSDGDIETTKLINDMMSNLDSWKKDLKLLEEHMTTDNDRFIVEQLRIKIKRTQLELDNMKASGRYIASVDDTVKRTGFAIENSEMDYNATKDEADDLKKDYENLLAERKKLEAEDLAIGRELASLKPTLEYINSLKSKLTQVQMLVATIQTDLIFDQNPSAVQRFTRTSLPKVILFAFAVTIFLMFIGITIRYLLDRKILNGEEMRRMFPEHEIIGRTPDFT
jgi:predicted  nucleic acid-binding Zn-ribbon protein